MTDAVPAVIAAPIDVEAVVTLADVAKVPESRVPSESLRVAYDQTSAADAVPPVMVLVPFVHTSAAREPNDESVLSELAQIAVGNVDARDDEAVKMAALVFELTAAVPAVIAVAIEDEAVPTTEFVLAFTPVVTAEMPVASELEAARTVALVLLLTAEVPAVMAEAIDEEAEFVLAFTAAVTAAVCVSVFEFTAEVPDVIAAPSDVDAVVMLAAVARVPESRVLSESRRVA